MPLVELDSPFVGTLDSCEDAEEVVKRAVMSVKASIAM